MAPFHDEKYFSENLNNFLMLMKADIEVTGSEKIFYRYNILNEFMRQLFFKNDIFLVIQIFANLSVLN